MKMWQFSAFLALLLATLVVEVYCKPALEQRTKRQAAVEDRQIIGGLSTIGALLQPILFMIGMANFMGRIPMMFNRMRDRFSSTLSGTGAPAGAGRRKRDLSFLGDEEDKSYRALRMISEAESKFSQDS